MKRIRDILTMTCLGLLLLLASGGAAEPVAVAQTFARYGSFPKGVTVEGSAAGMDLVRSVAYDRRANDFVINGGSYYRNPLNGKEFKALLTALRRDRRLGVSLTLDQKVIVYGALGDNGWTASRIASAMAKTDNFFRGVVYAKPYLLKGIDLPGGYQPKAVANRRRFSAVHFNFAGYRFVRDGNRYRCGDCNLRVTLIPTKAAPAADGGYEPDYAALQRGEIYEEDLANVAHIQRHQQAYLRIPVVAKSVRYGEAAAFARHLLNCGADVEALLKQM